MSTQTKKKGPSSFSISEEDKNKIILQNTLQAIGTCKISKDANDNQLHPYLDKALSEIKEKKPEVKDYCMEVFLRNLFYVFSIQREHNIWKEEGVKSAEIGAQMRSTGRSITRWLVNNMPEWLYQRRDGYLYNLNLLAEYANYDLLTHNQITTKAGKGKGKDGSKKNPNRVVAHEKMNVPTVLVAELMAQNLRRGKGLSLIARWLPKFTNKTSRVSKLVVGKDLKRKEFNTKGKEWVKINGEKTTQDLIPLKEGDQITYPRPLQEQTLKRLEYDKALIVAFCKAMDWDIKKYKEFRHEHMQHTPENYFSSHRILKLTRDQFEKWLNGLSAGQQWVVSSTLCYKGASGKLEPRPNTRWEKTDLPSWYISWSSKEQETASEIREAMASNDTVKVKELTQKAKVKSTGTQTIDLFTDLLVGNRTEDEINMLHTNIIAKMDMFVPVYCVIDGSGSMGSNAMSINGQIVRCIDIAMCLAVTFMVTNPVEEYRSSCMWFGSETTFTGVTKFANNSPNQFVHQQRFVKQTEPKKVCDPAWTFLQNCRSLKSANPGHVASTNVGMVVTTFMELVTRGALTAESLPKVLLFITDEERNAGVRPVETDGSGFTQIPQLIGWNPLFVFWGMKLCRFEEYEKVPNCLVVRGYSENTLSQILQFIRKGSINMYDELFAVHEMPGMSLIQYP